MKPFFPKLLVLLLILGVGPPLARADFDFGDFKVTDNAIDTGITFFDTAFTNPAPFPEASVIQQANTYPAFGAGDITVGEIQAFLDGEGLPNDKFGLCLVLGPYGELGIASLVITVDGEVVAISDGVLIIESFLPGNDVTYFIPETLDLDDYDPDAEVLVSYGTFTSTEDIVRINMAATPEPASMLFLGTGIVAIILMRTKRKRE